MELTEQQKTAVGAWVREGCGLSEIQRRLASEFGLRPTFMDVRFLILDLGLEIQDGTGSCAKPADPVKESEEEESGETEETDVENEGDDDLPETAAGQPPAGSGGVSVQVDLVMKPGALISGTVTFSDGVTAAWALDQYGRLALDSKQPGYRPSPEDIEGFQQALQQEVAKKGY